MGIIKTKINEVVTYEKILPFDKKVVILYEKIVL